MVSGVQRYLCHSCRKSFRNKRKPTRLRQSIWQSFVSERNTARQLALKYDRCVNWIRKELREYKLPSVKPIPREFVAVLDCVFFGRKHGYLVVRDPHRADNVYWMPITSETIDEYQCARDTLESLGFKFKGVVIDGKPGVRTIFSDMPVQMCQFHQILIISRYLTRRPAQEAARELSDMVACLPYVSEACMEEGLSDWHNRWQEFMNERTTNPETGRWHYTHKRLRSAYRSIKKNLPFLFTYQRVPNLQLPNTTNSLDGTFAHLKGLVKIHRGLKPDLKHKMILSILQNRHRKK